MTDLKERIVRLFDIYVRRLMVEGRIDLEQADKDRALFGDALTEVLVAPADTLDRYDD